MKEFALKHPYLTVFLLVPVAVSGVVHLAQAIRGEPKKLPSADPAKS